MRLSDEAKLSIGVGAGLGALISLLIVVLAFRRRWRRHRQVADVEMGPVSSREMGPISTAVPAVASIRVAIAGAVIQELAPGNYVRRGTPSCTAAAGNTSEEKGKEGVAPNVA